MHLFIIFQCHRCITNRQVLRVCARTAPSRGKGADDGLSGREAAMAANDLERWAGWAAHADRLDIQALIRQAIKRHEIVVRVLPGGGLKITPTASRETGRPGRS
jgi:hypothetical protein